MIDGYISKIEEKTLEDGTAFVRVTVDIFYNYWGSPPLKPEKDNFYYGAVFNKDRYERALRIYEDNMKKYNERIKKEKERKLLHIGRCKIEQPEEEM